MNHQSHQTTFIGGKIKSTHIQWPSRKNIWQYFYMCFLVWKYGSFITLFPSTHVERLYIIIPYQVLHLEQQPDSIKIQEIYQAMLWFSVAIRHKIIINKK